MQQPLCRAPMYFPRDNCFRKASVLATDVAVGDPMAYVAVCKVHFRQAMTRGLQRAAKLQPGYRIPVMVLPLDTAAPSPSA